MTRCLVLLALAAAGFDHSTDWPSYGNDPGAMRYSTLRQIHTGNVDRLTLAWTFRTGKPVYSFESIGGTEYARAALPFKNGGLSYVLAVRRPTDEVPRAASAVWISRYRSALGASWRLRQVVVGRLGTAFLLVAPFFGVMVFFATVFFPAGTVFFCACCAVATLSQSMATAAVAPKIILMGASSV